MKSKLHISDGEILDKEGPQLEFKDCSKGIPNSTWETYSSFANTNGGLIVLGIKEDGEKNILLGCEKPSARINDLWNTLRNNEVINLNILKEEDICLEVIDEKNIIFMNVPRADRRERPIYYKSIDSGTFKRINEGDYHCNSVEIGMMMRDKSDVSYDYTIIESTGIDDIDMNAFHEYRQMIRNKNPDHPWNNANDEEFLILSKAMSRKDERELTLAGLLMFGKEYVIYDYISNYKLDYLEFDNQKDWSNRIVTGDGTWEGNLFNFYRKVGSSLMSDIKAPLSIGKDMVRDDEGDVKRAIRECFMNSIIHADFLGRDQIRIERYPDRIEISNSGLFRIPLDEAENGGESDPRNVAIASMFMRLGLVEKEGIGVRYILDVWKNNGFRTPVIEEDHKHNRVKFILYLSKEPTTIQEKIKDIISNNPDISIDEIADKLNVSRSTAYNNIREMQNSGTIRREGKRSGRWIITS